MNDFTIGTNSYSITVEQGQLQTIGVNIGYLGAFNGTVSNFSCSGLPVGTTCSFSSSQVTSQGAITLTVTTTPVGQALRRASRESRGIGWTACATLPLLGICLIGIPSWRRRGALPALVVFSCLTLLSCGGGGGGGGSGQQVTNNPVPSIASILPTQQAAGSVGQTLTITGSGFVGDSNVTYNGAFHAATYMGATQLLISLTANDLATTGSYPVVVVNPAPGGGSSSTVDFNVVTGTPTGTFTVTVTASSGSLTHSTNFTLIVNP